MTYLHNMFDGTSCRRPSSYLFDCIDFIFQITCIKCIEEVMGDKSGGELDNGKLQK